MSTYEYDELHERDAQSTRPHSIDLTLELERQLEAESLPTSTAVAAGPTRPQSLDPHVLASIVTQLRLSLVDVTKERDELASSLAEVQANQTGMKDALEHVADKCTRLEAELGAAQDKNKEDGDAITMLRGKLEDSRRALMRLQTENRRNSQISNMALDLSRPGATALSGPPSAKRMSFTPLTGSPAHRRISSVSEPGNLSTPHFGDSSIGDALSTPSRRLSGFFGRPSPVQPELPRLVDASEMEELRKELQTVKEQLDETRHELSESQEGCEASETCVRALRTFIAENNIGLGETRGPGTTASRSAVSPETPARNGATRWGFKLWTTSNPGTPVSSPALPSSVPPVSAAPPALSKLGGFFSSRASISSTTSSRQEALPARELTSNGSETSSMDELVVEPVSPVSEVPRSAVVVRVDSEPSSDSIVYPTLPPAKEVASLDTFGTRTNLA